jgi:hypothetical protein
MVNNCSFKLDDLKISNLNADFDGSSVPDAVAVDLAYVAFGNFISGKYIQSGDNEDAVNVNITITNSGVLKAPAFLVANGEMDPSFSSQTSYRAALKDSGMVAGAGAVANAHGKSITAYPYDHSKLHGLTNHSANSPISNNQATNSNLDEVLINAATAAIFKRFGDNSAILNDSEIKAKVSEIKAHYYTQLHNQSANQSTALWKRYVASGNFRLDNEASKDVEVNMNLEGAPFSTKITLSGTVADSVADDGIDLSNELINTVFGTGSKLAMNGSNAQYSIDLLLTLVQQA